MYDPETADLIRSAPHLDGLEVEGLPEFLTSSFASIAAARVRLREGSIDQDEDLAQLVLEMQRLALSYEALVSITPDRDNRTAAAFVAGSAHHLCFNARAIGNRDDVPTTYLGVESISPDIAAVLLFLIAEAAADASEIADSFGLNADSVVEQSLVSAIKSLAKGNLVAIVEAAMPARGLVRDIADPASAASLALYFTLLRGVRELAAELLGADGSEPGRAMSTFKGVIGLSIAEGDTTDRAWDRPQIGAFAGPFHLASLLVAVARDLGDCAVTKIEPPGGVDAAKWAGAMRRVARSRPYLWRNHSQAIGAGYLELETSAAVSFPTGAGKSTLAELKMTATLLADRKVIFLAPTNALVGQTTRSLRRAFRKTNVGQERFDEVGFLSEDDELPQIFVMTPESCLAQMSIEPEVFEGVGLLVFDECHLLHARDQSDSRRALDAMLCLLNFGALVPDASLLLLSAMMKNTDEIAGWVKTLTGRDCLALDLPWKPTRQLRGSVVYQQTVLEDLQDGLAEARNAKETKNPSVKNKAALKAEALAFFGLKQTWATRSSDDYSLVSLLDEPVQLGANNSWRLTPNAGEVSSAIASAAAQSELKTLIFFQTIPNANAAKNRIRDRLGVVSIPLTDDENAWMNVTSLELGESEHCYLDVEEAQLKSLCVVHHGLLLPEERQLCESLYQRSDGASVLAATSTVAQGMNFPSELVIIGEDSRFEADANKREVLEAQELLNAAGRAGRAGQNANGIVLVVPGRVVGIDLEEATIGSHWSTLQSIFGQSDQCLEIDDPLTAILDRVHANVEDASTIEKYAISRLDSAGIEASLTKSLAGFHARNAGNENWLQERIQSALNFYNDGASEAEDQATEQRVSSKLGVPLDVVACLSPEIAGNEQRTIIQWIEWFFDWIEKNSELFDQMLRPSTIDDFFGSAIDDVEGAAERTKLALPLLRELTGRWMAGQPLCELELAFGTQKNRLGTCIHARKFVLRVVPELAYLFGIPAFLTQNRQAIEGEAPKELPASLAKLGACLRLGYESVELHALSYYLRQHRLSRRQIHEQFASVQPHLADAPDGEHWEGTVDRVENAVIAELNSRG